MKNIACTVVATVEMDASVRTEDGLTLVEVLERDAFRRGAEAMREVAAKFFACCFPAINNGAGCGHCRNCESDWGADIRALPIPEDKP